VKVTGLVMATRRTTSKHGRHRAVTISRHDTPPGDTVTLRYLNSSYLHQPVKGETITIDGVPLMGYKRVNIGGVTVTKL
jgi:hypothetical protein